MLLEYSYDKFNDIIDKFEKSEVASLDITQSDSGAFVMSCVLIDELPEPKQNLVRAALAASLPDRIEILNVLNQFMEVQIMDGVNSFSLHFNAINVKEKCEISYFSSFKPVMEDTGKSLLVELEKCLEHYDLLVTKLAVSDVEIENVFTRTSGSRNKKYVPVTLSDFGNVIRKELAKG